MRILRRLVPVVIGTFLLLALAGPARASGHTGLVASDPPAGSSVTIAPLFVRLDFGHPLLDLGVAVQVRGPGGSVVSSGAPRLYPTTVTQALAGDLPPGRYQVSWRVTGEDGLPVSGQFAFTAQEPSTASVAAPDLPGATPSPAAVAGRAAAGPGALLGLVAAAVGIMLVLGLLARVLAGRRGRGIP